VSNEEGDMEDGDPGADKHPHRNRDQRGSKFLHQVLKPKDKKDCARNGRSLYLIFIGFNFVLNLFIRIFATSIIKNNCS